MSDAPSNLMTVPEFSVHLGYGRTYGYQLKKEGRLAMAEDGKHVLVAESTALVRGTEDPAKQPVAARHAAARQARAVSAPAATEPDDEPATAEDAAPGAEEPTTGYNFQNSKAKREHWAAERELAQFRKEAGELMEVSEHVAAFAQAGATMRAGLESWASILPAQLVGRDEASIRALIAEQVEHLLRELSAQIGKQAGEGAV